ncbi:anthranilate synthase component 1 (plasmid) [Buchnera aphidicola (Mindarus keteleerifoliae)]|uniref:anthranilate synthase component 1 n=1 Tax=Buchnera aphidicola TaxID=9 RepID=UPI0031B70EFA
MNNKIYTKQKKTIYRSDPTIIFHNICKKKHSTLLLESAEIKNKHALESMIISDTALKIFSKKNTVTFVPYSKNGKEIIKLLLNSLSNNIKIISYKKNLILKILNETKNFDEDKKLRSNSIFECFRLMFKNFKKSEKYPKSMFFGGLFSYDLVSNFEKLPSLKDDNECPDFCFYLAEVLIILDHKKKTCLIQTTLFKKNHSEEERLANRVLEIEKKLLKLENEVPFKKIKNFKLTKNISDSEFCKIVKKMKIEIQNGEIFQIVPSRKFYLPCENSLLSYKLLKKENPSPYMFFMQDKEFILFGASPESSLKFNPINREIEIYPIAGTRPRGKKEDGSIDLDLDSRIELEMRTDQKELSEHLMLVDLARNDLAKICEPGTRYVSELMKVDKYSCVMHLVSKVVGKLKTDLDIFHAYQACMNMGTLTGAPKIKAMELISKIEKKSRGSYGGSIGYFTISQIFDTCIIIRSAYVKDKVATIQSGAGVVFDSIPKEEANESKNKALAVLMAISKAHNFKGDIF